MSLFTSNHSAQSLVVLRPCGSRAATASLSIFFTASWNRTASNCSKLGESKVAIVTTIVTMWQQISWYPCGPLTEHYFTMVDKSGPPEISWISCLLLLEHTSGICHYLLFHVQSFSFFDSIPSGIAAVADVAAQGKVWNAFPSGCHCAFPLWLYHLLFVIFGQTFFKFLYIIFEIFL